MSSAPPPVAGRLTGFRTLLWKELLRFWKVGFQTVGAPIVTALLYLLIFGHVLDAHVRVFEHVSYTAFLVPGLAMMAVLQNAFANASSSLIQAKTTGSLVFVLLPPISYFEFFLAYVLAAAIRGVVVGGGVIAATAFLAWPGIHAPLWVISFALAGGALMGALGLVAGIWAEKYDQLSAFQNFLILPLTMLSGVFYSLDSLPPFWQRMSHFNPVFYMIDGFRYGFFGASDASPWLSLGVLGAVLGAATAFTLALLARGYKLRS